MSRARIRYACTVEDGVGLPDGPPAMAREFDRQETERQRYIQDHGSTKHLKERITELEKKNDKLKKKIEKLEDK
jgi:predicted RNase H-like nuclease (RuvC/YqgF family)